jgi:hypothetical protein
VREAVKVGEEVGVGVTQRVTLGLGVEKGERVALPVGVGFCGVKVGGGVPDAVSVGASGEAETVAVVQGEAVPAGGLRVAFGEVVGVGLSVIGGVGVREGEGEPDLEAGALVAVPGAAAPLLGVAGEVRDGNRLGEGLELGESVAVGRGEREEVALGVRGGLVEGQVEGEAVVEGVEVSVDEGVPAVGVGVERRSVVGVGAGSVGEAEVEGLREPLLKLLGVKDVVGQAKDVREGPRGEGEGERVSLMEEVAEGEEVGLGEKVREAQGVEE